MQYDWKFWAVRVMASTSTLAMIAGCAGETGEEEIGAHATALEAGSAKAGGAAAPSLCAIPGTTGEHLSHLSGVRFDYDPAGLAVDRIRGRIKPNQGKIRWMERPHADSYLDRIDASGSFTPTLDGATLTYEVTAQEDSGAVGVTEVEEAWQGCQLTRRTRPAGGGAADWLTQQGSWDGQVYTYTQERISRTHGGRIVLDGERYADGSWSEYHEGTLNWSDIYETWSGDADGYTHVYWERNWGDSYIWGTDERFRDGGLHRYIRYVWEACVPWVDFTLGYDGTGAGAGTICETTWVEYDGEWWEEAYLVPCTISISGGSCTQTCDNGAVSSCDDLL